MLTVHCTAREIADAAWSRRCDGCRTAASAVYCRADLSYLCAACDGRVHGGGAAAGHERVLICEACERSPAAFVCKADSASLCAACDADVHSANPLARRHHRVPISPIPAGGGAASPSRLIIGRPGEGHDDGFLTVDGENSSCSGGDDDETAASWLLFGAGADDDKAVFGSEVDDYFDLDDYTDGNPFSCEYTKQDQYSSDSVVPIQFQSGNDWHQLASMVPESAMAESSMISHTRASKGTIDLFSGPPVQAPAQLSTMDREARVLRYREKKKNRKFEKTIRYASRKAYAESRPRIKGRFAKRTEVDRPFSKSMNAYGVVPSFEMC
ncbi:zinc finger protein CONSTANS-LIKE 2-like [Andrographis paniculata]|uniref:zinc finger protein CONSTANS-LIKE 2-like n=1 Tax=Andrographis paniculata TaxID=175694 RepID=UPI0021E8ECCB|nr:zinc finger protein CONSTANS-LIKE 2-like [Andrographis paniculata]